MDDGELQLRHERKKAGGRDILEPVVPRGRGHATSLFTFNR
jgi:hypothetical protein